MAEAAINHYDPTIPSIFALDGILSSSRRPQKRHVDALWTTTARGSQFIVAVAENHCCHLVVLDSESRCDLDLAFAAEHGAIESCRLLHHAHNDITETREESQWSLLLLTSDGQLYCGSDDHFSAELGTQGERISQTKQDKKVDATKLMTLLRLPSSQLSGMTTMTSCRGIPGLLCVGSSEKAPLLLEISLSSCEVLASHQMEYFHSANNQSSMTMVAMAELDNAFAQSLDKRLAGSSAKKELGLKAVLFYGLKDGTIWACGMYASPQQAHSSTACSKNNDKWLSKTLLVGGSWRQDQSIADSIAVKDEKTGLVYGIVFLGSKGDVAWMGSSGDLVTLMSFQEPLGRWSSLLQVRIQSSLAEEEGRVMIWATNETTGSTHLHWWSRSGNIAGADTATGRHPVPIRSDLLWSLPIHGDGSGTVRQKYFLGVTKGGAIIGFEVSQEYSWDDWIFSSFGTSTGGEPNNGEWVGTLRQATLRKKALQRTPEELEKDNSRKRIRQCLQQCSSLEDRIQQFPDAETLQKKAQLRETSQATQAILQTCHDIYRGNKPVLHGDIQTLKGQRRVVEVQVGGIKQYSNRPNGLQAALHVCLPIKTPLKCDPRTVDGRDVSVNYGGVVFSKPLSLTSTDPSRALKQKFVLPDHHDRETWVSSCLSVAPKYSEMGHPKRMNPVNKDKRGFWKAKGLGSGAFEQRMMTVASQNLEATPKK